MFQRIVRSSVCTTAEGQFICRGSGDDGAGLEGREGWFLYCRGGGGVHMPTVCHHHVALVRSQT
jgi:hypothetical protein